MTEEEKENKNKEEENKKENSNEGQKPEKDKKKQEKKLKSSKNKKPKKTYLVYGIVLIVLGLAIFFGISMGPQEDNKEETIVAKVNQEEITREDLDAYKVMLEQEGGASDDMTAIQSLINQKILYQEAKKEIEMSSGETEQIIKQQLSNQGMTLEDFKNQVEAQGQNYEEVMKSFEKQLILSQYSQNIINESEVNITDKEAKGLLQEKIMDLRENADIEIIEENLNQTQPNQMDLSQLQQQ